MLVLDVSIKGGVAEVSLPTCTYIISLSCFVSGPSLSLVLLDDGHVIAFVVGLLRVHSCVFKSMYINFLD